MTKAATPAGSSRSSIRSTARFGCILVLALCSSASAQQGETILINDIDLLKRSNVNARSARPVRMSEEEAIDVDLSTIKSEAELKDLERILSRSLSTRYYNQYRDLLEHRCNGEIRSLHLVAKLRRSELEELEPILRLAAKKCLLEYCQDLAALRYQRAAGWSKETNGARLNSTKLPRHSPPGFTIIWPPNK